MKQNFHYRNIAFVYSMYNGCLMRVQKRKCPMAVNDKFCSEAIRNQLESSIASRAAIRVAYEHGTDATYNLITSTFKNVYIIWMLLQTCTLYLT